MPQPCLGGVQDRAWRQRLRTRHKDLNQITLRNLNNSFHHSLNFFPKPSNAEIVYDLWSSFFFFLTLKLSEQKQWSSPQKTPESYIWLCHLSSLGRLEVKEKMYHGAILASVGLLRVQPSSEDI